MNFISVTNRYGRKVVIRWDVIQAMEEVDVPVTVPGFPDKQETWTVIKYGEFGMSKSHDVAVKESTEEILRLISAPTETKIDPEDSYYSLLEMCEKIASHNLEPEQAVAVVQSFIHQRLAEERERLEREILGREQNR